MKLLLTAMGMMILSSFVSGCGRPPPAGGPPGEFSVDAVVAIATTDTVRISVQLVGSLRARDAVDVVSEINAPVKEILFTEGEAVVAGQPLVRLDDAKLKARMAEAAARHQLARTNLERSQELLESQTISRQEYDQAQSEFAVAEAVLKLLERELEDTVINAPFDGVTSDRQISPGQFLSIGHPVTRLVRMDPLEVEFRLPERYASLVKEGQQVIMNTTALPGTAINGEIFFIDPILDAASRTVLVKAHVPNPEAILKPGMFGNLDVVIEERPDAVVIPESSIRYRGDQAYVMLVNAETRAELRNVTVGQRMAGRVEITSGLAAGDLVVVEGFQKMGPGTSVIISPASEKYGVAPSATPAP